MFQSYEMAEYPIQSIYMTYSPMNSAKEKTPGLPDEQVLQYYINGDANAKVTLVELYKDRVYNSIFRMVPDKADADEIFQAVFIQAIDNMIAGKAVEEGKFLSWAMQIAHSLCLEHKSTNINVATADSQHAKIKNKPVESFLSVHPFESHSRMRGMIELLPAAQREVVLLNHYAGLSFNEIASITKCSLTSALETMRYALRNLQKQIANC